MSNLTKPILGEYLLERSKARAGENLDAAYAALSERDRLRLPVAPDRGDQNIEYLSALLAADQETLKALADDEAMARALSAAITDIRARFDTPYGSDEIDVLTTKISGDLNRLGQLKVRIETTRARLARLTAA